MSAEQTLKAVRGSFIDFTRTAETPQEIAPALRFIEGVRLENGNYPTLRLFFVQSGIDCT